MSYVNRSVQRNFFETLGKDGSGQVNSWLENSKFLKTSQLKKMQEQYQEDFKKKYFTKMEEWEYEEEFRLLVDGLAINFEEERFFKYKDNALKGVCFGLATSSKDKARILEVLRKTSKDLNDFRCLMDLMNEIRDSWELDRIKSYFQKKKTQFELLDCIRENFSHLYVNQLKDIIYPEGFVVCFSVENDNSVMWGNYADKHRGVCLVYELEINSETGKVELEAAASGRKINAEAGSMSYVNRPVQRNFFETLGKDGSGQVNSWLENSKFLKTSQLKKMQEQYQEDFKKKYFTKMEEWEYEEEFRLLVDGLAINFEEERFFKYKDNALKGVCFGLATSSKDKARILEVLRKTSKDLNDFRFFQAEYNETKRCIKIRENTNMEVLFRNKANFNRS